MVTVVVPVFVRVVGLNVAEAPDGRPLVPKVTVELYPPAIVSVAVEVPELPAETGMFVGEVDNEKFFTVSVIFCVCVTEPTVPVTVIV